MGAIPLRLHYPQRPDPSVCSLSAAREILESAPALWYHRLRTRRRRRALCALRFPGGLWVVRSRPSAFFCFCRDAPRQSNATSELSTEQRIAALQSVRDQVASAQGKDPAAAAESLVTYLRGRAEFAEAGIRQGSVWAVLHDGRQLVIPAEAFAPLPTASSPSRAPAPRSTAETEIPEGKAVLVNTTGVQIEGSEFGALSVDLRGMKYTLFPTTGDYWRMRTDVAAGTREIFHWKTQSGRNKQGDYVLASIKSVRSGPAAAAAAVRRGIDRGLDGAGGPRYAARHPSERRPSDRVPQHGPVRVTRPHDRGTGGEGSRAGAGHRGNVRHDRRSRCHRERDRVAGEGAPRDFPGRGPAPEHRSGFHRGRAR